MSSPITSLSSVPVPVIPDTAPFTLEQRTWLNGYLAGLFSRGTVDPSVLPRAATESGAALRPLTVLFGSQTGTAEGLAKRAAKEAGRRGFAATVMDMASYSVAQLAQEKNVLILTSTYGDGEPPDNAKALHAAVCGEGAPALAGLRFSVCGLGDTNYAQFCRCGRDFDAALEKLGAVRVAPRVDCDVTYEEKFSSWLDAAIGALSGAAAPENKPDAGVDKTSQSHAAVISASTYDRQHPFPAGVIKVSKLNGAGSAKEVNHVELSLEGSGLAYEAGDALGVVPQNYPDLVEAVLAVLGCDGEEAVPTPAGELPLRTALTTHYDLGRPTPELRELLWRSTSVAAKAGSATEAPAAAVDVLDVLRSEAGMNLTPMDLVTRLKRLQPRLYSIASSSKAHPGEVHLTVRAVRYETGERVRKGVCSTFLADRVFAAGRVGVYVHVNRSFRLPENADLPVIMIGPGTGIAPFRAFLEERRAIGARGRNWLFFGDQSAATDFLYREELQEMKESGLLARLDLAWSRDGGAKVYVQHRMLEAAAEFWAWLEAGAYIYVCGDASRMAKDVDTALHQIIEKAGGKSAEAAAACVQQLRAAKRYCRDVY